MRRALFRIARAELVMLTVAREIASMSPPTLNASRMSFPLNWAWKPPVWIEKSPYGSWCSTRTMPVSFALRSRPTRYLIGPS